MIVLGIDPGTASLGYGLVDRTGSRLRAIDFGVVPHRRRPPLPDRLLAIHAFLQDLIELHGPTYLGVERIFHSRNVQTALAVGHARGVVLLVAAAHQLEIREATPSEVKIAVTGYGSADKGQVGRMVQAILGHARAAAPRRRGGRARRGDLDGQPRTGGRADQCRPARPGRGRAADRGRDALRARRSRGPPARGADAGGVGRPAARVPGPARSARPAARRPRSAPRAERAG